MVPPFEGMLQAKPGRSGKKQLEQKSRNLGTSFLPLAGYQGRIILHSFIADNTFAKTVSYFDLKVDGLAVADGPFFVATLMMP